MISQTVTMMMYGFKNLRMNIGWESFIFLKGTTKYSNHFETNCRESKSANNVFQSCPYTGSSICRALIDEGMVKRNFCHPFTEGFGSMSNRAKVNGYLAGSQPVPSGRGGGLGLKARTFPRIVWLPAFHSWCIQEAGLDMMWWGVQGVVIWVWISWVGN